MADDDGDGGWWEDPEGMELPEPYKSIGVHMLGRFLSSSSNAYFS